jgi:plasma-membrane proton-efflux P-type ATPase
LPPGALRAPRGENALEGLSSAEARARLARDGANEVAERPDRPLARFLRHFWGVSAWMLELIMALSLALGKWTDFAVVAALLVVNAVIGYAQEGRTAAAVAMLRRRLQVGARVLRDGAWDAIPARELVQGDLVRLRRGDVVPADVRLLEGELALDQSALTGETAEVARGVGDTAHSGALVRRGEASAEVLLTGARTLFGRTTELVALARPKLHVEEVVGRVVRWLFVIVGTLLGAVAILALARGAPLVELAPLLLVLLMSAVPVALPVMFTVSMAVGAAELARRGVLVTRLSAAEDAASMDVLCVDKTGTITQNRLEVSAVFPLGGASEAEVLAAGAAASQEADQDPIDLAFLAAARARGVSAAAARLLRFTPFDPATRRTEALVELEGRRVRVLKGALGAIAEACGVPREALAPLEARAHTAAATGARMLAVARGPEDGAPALLGLVALYDPPRPDAAGLVGALRALGVQVKMLTGDAPPVAQEIARRVGLGEILRAADLKAAGEHGAPALLARADGLAEVYPEDKYLVVRALQRAGRIAGMTGDGVNDAPALRQAEVGIAVSGATDVARGAASVVLTEPGLANIVALVEQGRVIYQRVLTWIINKVSRTVLKAGYVASAYVLTGKFVVSAFAMLLLVFMTDFAKVALATDRVRGARAPESWAIGGFVGVSAALGLLMVAELLLLLHLCWTPFALGSRDDALHSFSFLALLYFAVFSILSARERRPFYASAPGRALAAALALDAAIGTALVALGLPGLAPLPWTQVLAVLGYALLACLGVNDLVKVALLRRLA